MVGYLISGESLQGKRSRVHAPANGHPAPDPLALKIEAPPIARVRRGFLLVGYLISGQSLPGKSRAFTRP